MQAIVFSGIQATGKSSFYRERFFHTHVRINLDTLRTRHRERVLLRACLDALQPLVVDKRQDRELPDGEEYGRFVRGILERG